MPDLVFLNGKLVPADEAKVSVFDAGFTHAAGLFETMRAYNGCVMRLDQHLDRLIHSATALGLQVPAAMEAELPTSKEELRSAIYQVLEANELKEARVRLVMTPGSVHRAPAADEHPLPPTVLVNAGPVHRHPPELYRTGMRVCICPYKQNRDDPLAGHKTLAYLPRLLAMRDASNRRCNESLWFTNQNLLAEGTICNIFIVKDGAIVTPPVDTPVLPGTVRQAVIELAQAQGISMEERPIDIEHLLAAQEVFLTGSVLEIMPVTAIERHVVSQGEVGPMTVRMSAAYTQLVAKECGTDG